MGYFDKFIYLSIGILVILVVFFYNKTNQYRENFEDVFHITDAKDYQFDKVLVNPANNSASNNAKYDNDGLYLNKVYVSEYNKLFVGNSAETETNFSYNDLKTIKETKFPYIKNTSQGERLVFNQNDEDKYYLDADNLRALQGKMLVPIYNERNGMNKYAVKINAQPSEFDLGGFKCGFSGASVNDIGRITNYISQDTSY